jgi:hypothetical protein
MTKKVRTHKKICAAPTQNSRNLYPVFYDGIKRLSTMRSFVCGECASVFEIALQDSMTTEEVETTPISAEYVNADLKAIIETAFKFFAMKTQRLLMNRKMYKPVELTKRQMAALFIF